MRKGKQGPRSQELPLGLTEEAFDEITRVLKEEDSGTEWRLELRADESIEATSDMDKDGRFSVILFHPRMLIQRGSKPGFENRDNHCQTRK